MAGSTAPRDAWWQKQLHLFEVPFYYIEYGMAQLGAIAVWRNYKKDPRRTLEQYKAALAAGSTRTIPEVYWAAGIRFDFSEEYIRVVGAIDDPLFGRRYVSMPVEIDEDLLRNIAHQTGGKYFRATDTEKLREIYQEINEMEKTKIQVKEFTKYRELYVNYAGAGLLLLILEILLFNTVLRKLP